MQASEIRSEVLLLGRDKRTKVTGRSSPNKAGGFRGAASQREKMATSSANKCCLLVAPYMAKCIERNETCVVVATSEHRRQITAAMLELGCNCSNAAQRGQWQTYAVEDALGFIMLESMPNSDLVTAFFELIKDVAPPLTEPARIHVYTELVSALYAHPP